ncbi:hypothetical protein R3P38DRAFT_2801106 [Favolaschia claudopus]|uniref:Uncharacterized protein n=1 Tax=Favolaschia claudopus TaxID=2862362 RepID=A0AAV9ZWT5_9AGAR
MSVNAANGAPLHRQGFVIHWSSRHPLPAFSRPFVNPFPPKAPTLLLKIFPAIGFRDFVKREPRLRLRGRQASSSRRATLRLTFPAAPNFTLCPVFHHISTKSQSDKMQVGYKSVDLRCLFNLAPKLVRRPYVPSSPFESDFRGIMPCRASDTIRSARLEDRRLISSGHAHLVLAAIPPLCNPADALPDSLNGANLFLQFTLPKLVTGTCYPAKPITLDRKFGLFAPSLARPIPRSQALTHGLVSTPRIRSLPGMSRWNHKFANHKFAGEDAETTIIGWNPASHT